MGGGSGWTPILTSDATISRRSLGRSSRFADCAKSMFISTCHGGHNVNALEI